MKYRLFSLTAALLLLTGCSAQDWQAVFGKAESVPEPEPVIPYYDIDALKTKIENFEAQWSESGNDSEIEAEINTLISEVDKAYSIYIRTETAYYADWKNADLETCSNRTYSDYQVVSCMVEWAMANGSKQSAYPELFAPYVPEDDLNYYLYHNLNRIMAYAKNNAADSSELLDSYYDTAFEKEADPDKTNLACAELYLETLKAQDISEYLYDTYDRDYTVEQASAIYDEMKAQILPVYRSLFEYLTNLDGLTMSAPLPQDAYDLLKTYAPQLSAPIAESADKLLSESLYVRAEGDDCYNGSYTAALTGENSGLMYTYLDGTCYDLSTVVHEFGHFHADWRDSTPVYLQKPCQDIAEVQSQGMEVLFTSFYDDIFGERAGEYELAAIYNLLDSTVNGLAVGEFEYEVMQQLDTITPEETVALYAQFAEECDLAVELYQISHLYEQPGYYISYGMSALPALQLYTMMQEDPAKAADVYDHFAAISGLSGETGFCAALQECGFFDFTQPDAIQSLTDALSERIAELTETPAESERD